MHRYKWQLGVIYMFEAKRDERLANKFIQDDSDRMFAGVVIGNNPGKVWVDCLENPTSAIVWSDSLQCFQFLGCASNQAFCSEVKLFLENAIANNRSQEELFFFDFPSDEELWYPIVHNALADRYIQENWQYVYQSKSNSPEWTAHVISKPHCLHQIDDSFLSSIRNDGIVSNPEFLLNYIQQYWGSLEDFLKIGYGYAAVDEGKIVSIAISSFVYKQTHSIGIETLEQYRRKGFASSLVNMLLRTIYSKGCTVWWDCMDSNIASQRTAESAGLVFHHKYKVCWYNFL